MKLIREIKREISTELDLVSPRATLAQVFEILKFHSVSRVLFVVDTHLKLLGMVDVRTLLKLLASAKVKQESLTFFSEVSARTAEDVMVRSLAVREEDHLDKALQLMVETHTEDLAVVNAEGKITGSLNCFDVMNHLSSR